MAEQLFIRLRDDSELVSTIVLNADGHIVRGVQTQSLEASAGLCEGRRTTVLVPADSIVSLLADLPKANPARLRQMLAFSLEDSFADDIDNLHFAAGPRTESGRLMVSVVARSRLDAWLGRLAAAGVSPAAVCAVSEGVADTPSTTNLVLEGAATMGRRPGQTAFALDGLRLGEVWDLLEAEGEAGGDLQHVMLYLDRPALETRQQEIADLRSRVASLEARELPEGSLERLAAMLVFRPGTNLLQGSYTPRSNVAALLRPWYAAASLLLALVLIGIGSLGIEYLKLRTDDRRLTEQAAEICAASYSSPQLAPCRAEMERRLTSAGETATSRQTGFLATLAAVADSAADGMALEALNFRNDVMDLELIVPSVERLDAFREHVASATSLNVRILTYTPEDDAVKGRVQISGDDR